MARSITDIFLGENPVKVKRETESRSREDFGERQAGGNAPACFAA
jgi:hypothetical protein